MPRKIYLIILCAFLQTFVCFRVLFGEVILYDFESGKLQPLLKARSKFITITKIEPLSGSYSLLGDSSKGREWNLLFREKAIEVFFPQTIAVSFKYRIISQQSDAFHIYVNLSHSSRRRLSAKSKKISLGKISGQPGETGVFEKYVHLKPGRRYDVSIGLRYQGSAIIDDLAFSGLDDRNFFVQKNLHHQPVRIEADAKGVMIIENGEPFFVRSVNWSYQPRGYTKPFDLWEQPPDFIAAVLDAEMPMLVEMKLNTVSIKNNVPARWVNYIHFKFGLRVIVVESMSPWGFRVRGKWRSQTDYRNEEIRRLIKQEALNRFEKYHHLPGILFYQLGEGINHPYVLGASRGLELAEEIAVALKEKDDSRLILLGLYRTRGLGAASIGLDKIDIIGVAGRGKSYKDEIQKINEDIEGRPVIFYNVRCDAWDAFHNKPAPTQQAQYLLDRWKEIVTQSYGHGQRGVVVGGVIYAWADDWKKQPPRDKHNTRPKGEEGGLYDSQALEGNVNEEWFGLTALGSNDDQGWSVKLPRAAYYTLKKALKYDPYAKNSSLARADRFLNDIRPDVYLGNGAPLGLQNLSEEVKKLQFNLSLYLDMVLYDEEDVERERGGPITTEHTQSADLGIKFTPSRNLSSEAVFNILGFSASNLIRPFRYENRLEQIEVESTSGRDAVINYGRQIDVKKARIKHTSRYLTADMFYRTNRANWQRFGDFFGIYEGEYDVLGTSLRWRTPAPLGLELAGRGAFQGFRVVGGTAPGGSRIPSVLAIASREIIRDLHVALVHSEQLRQRSEPGNIVGQDDRFKPIPLIRQTSANLRLKMLKNKLTFYGGLLFSSPQKIGEPYERMETTSEETPFFSTNNEGVVDQYYQIFREEVSWLDTLAFKMRATWALPFLKFMFQGKYAGIVADSPREPIWLFSQGWPMFQDNGSGNKVELIGAARWEWVPLSVQLNGLWREPIVGPNFETVPTIVGETAVVGPPLRNVIDHPFAVYDSAGKIKSSIYFVYDPTPATRYFDPSWVVKEDAFISGHIEAELDADTTEKDTVVAWTVPEGGDGRRSGFWQPYNNPKRTLWRTKVALKLAPSWIGAISASYEIGTKQSYNGVHLQYQGMGLDILERAFSWKTQVRLNDWDPQRIWVRIFGRTIPVQVSSELKFHLMGGGFQQKTKGEIGVLGILQHENSDDWRYNIIIFGSVKQVF